jgi:hypothetical protein
MIAGAVTGMGRMGGGLRTGGRASIFSAVLAFCGWVGLAGAVLSYGLAWGGETEAEEIQPVERSRIMEALSAFSTAFLEGDEKAVAATLAASVDKESRKRIVRAVRKEFRMFRYVEFRFGELVAIEPLVGGRFLITATMKYRAEPVSAGGGIRPIENETSTALTMVREDGAWKIVDAAWFAMIGRTAEPSWWTTMVAGAAAAALALTFWGWMIMASWRERIGGARAQGWWRSWRLWVIALPILGALVFLVARRFGPRPSGETD